MKVTIHKADTRPDNEPIQLRSTRRGTQRTYSWKAVRGGVTYGDFVVVDMGADHDIDSDVEIFNRLLVQAHGLLTEIDHDDDWRVPKVLSVDGPVHISKSAHGRMAITLPETRSSVIAPVSRIEICADDEVVA